MSDESKPPENYEGTAFVLGGLIALVFGSCAGCAVGKLDERERATVCAESLHQARDRKDSLVVVAYNRDCQIEVFPK